MPSFLQTTCQKRRVEGAHSLSSGQPCVDGRSVLLGMVHNGLPSKVCSQGLKAAQDVLDSYHPLRTCLWAAARSLCRMTCRFQVRKHRHRCRPRRRFRSAPFSHNILHARPSSSSRQGCPTDGLKSFSFEVVPRLILKLPPAKQLA